MKIITADNKEIFEEFNTESSSIFEELEEIAEALEDDPKNNKLFESFGQKVDRIMGAAYSLELNRLGKLCELGKNIGYRVSQTEDRGNRDIICSLLLDLVEIGNSYLNEIMQTQALPDHLEIDGLINKLEIADKQYSDIQRKSLKM
jgi:chemotaxis protein histidine kinase CheA